VHLRMLVIGGLLLAAGGGTPLSAGDPLGSLAEQLGLRERGGRFTCGLPLTLYVLEQGRSGRLPAGVNAAAFLSRPTMQTSILRNHFRIHFDTSGTEAGAMLDAAYQRIPGSAREYAEWIATLAESSYRAETTLLGYLPAPPDQGTGGGDEYDVYIRNLDTLQIYGRTIPEIPIGSRTSTTYIEVDNDFTFVTPDSLKGLPAAAVTLAHEYHHAIQLGNYGDWGFDNIWYYEMTSVWMEDIVFPDVNDYYSYLRSSSGHFHHPEIPFTAPQYIVYSRGIWCHFLARRFSSDLIRLSWENIISLPPLEALDLSLQAGAYNSTFRSAFAEWALWNYFTGVRTIPGQYYEDASSYPVMITGIVGFTPPGRSLSDVLAPFSSRYYQVLYHADTLALIPSNLDFESARIGDLQPQAYTYLLDVERPDPTYRETAAGIFVKLETAAPSVWYSWEIVNGGISSSPLREGLAFPNPFYPDGHSTLSIAVPVTAPATGSLSIFDASMNRVYSGEGTTSLLLGNFVFSWNGRTDNGAVAQTGVYIFVLDLPEQRITGKFALIRK
jgi:hypothetical protein